MPSCKYLTAIKISVCGKKSQQDLKRVGVYVRVGVYAQGRAD